MPEIGKEYGWLTVDKQVNPYKYQCTCRCGNQLIAWGTRLDKGWNKSCGCLKGKGMFKHGLSDLPEYAIWLAMRQRCLNSNHPSFHRYGGRGISICKRWNDFTLFLADVGYRPSPELTLERRNNNGNYEPDNCVWATRDLQMNNLENTVFLTYEGRVLSISHWAADLGVKKATLRRRYDDGLPVSSILSTVALSSNQHCSVGESLASMKGWIG